MSLLLLIDGYNVIAPVAAPAKSPPADWLRVERDRLIDRLRSLLPQSIHNRVCIVFDARCPPPGRDSRYSVGGIDIRFAVDYPEADDLIEKLINQHSAPKQLAVISSDHRIQDAARRRGALAFDSATWLDDLLDGEARLAVRIEDENRSNGAGQGRAGQGRAENRDEKPASQLSIDEVQDWLREFGLDK